jgi:hypothetical protein
MSLWDPWGTLVASRAKQIETRHWETRYRGPIAIHVAKRWDYEQEALLHEPYFRAALLEARYEGIWTGDRLPFGHVVAIAHLAACIPMRDLLHSEYASWLTEEERAFGDYSLGRFAWIFSQAGAIEPIPAKGAQGIWEWTPPADGWTARVLKDGPEVARLRRDAMRRALTGEGHTPSCASWRRFTCTCHYQQMLSFLQLTRAQERTAAMNRPASASKHPVKRAPRLPRPGAKSPHVQPEAHVQPALV